MSWSWGVDDNALDAELEDQLEQATTYIDERRDTIDTMEENLQAAVERSVPESERKPDYRNPTEYQGELISRGRELVTSRLLTVGGGLLISVVL